MFLAEGGKNNDARYPAELTQDIDTNVRLHGNPWIQGTEIN